MWRGCSILGISLLSQVLGNLGPEIMKRLGKKVAIMLPPSSGLLIPCPGRFQSGKGERMNGKRPVANLPSHYLE